MNRNGRTDLEIPIPGITLDYDAEALKNELIARGHAVGIIAQESGLSIIQVVESNYGKPGKGHAKGHQNQPTLLVGGADKRRDGTVGGL